METAAHSPLDALRRAKSHITDWIHGHNRPNAKLAIQIRMPPYFIGLDSTEPAAVDHRA